MIENRRVARRRRTMVGQELVLEPGTGAAAGRSTIGVGLTAPSWALARAEETSAAAASQPTNAQRRLMKDLRD